MKLFTTVFIGLLSLQWLANGSSISETEDPLIRVTLKMLRRDCTVIAHNPMHEKKTCDNMTTHNNDIFIGNVTVGGQTFLVNFDTGSDRFWVMKKEANTEIDGYVQSDTYESVRGLFLCCFPVKRRFVQRYVDKCLAQCKIVRETVKIGTITLTQQAMGLAEVTEKFEKEQYNGIFGLGLRSDETNLLSAMIENKAFEPPVFALYLSKNEGELVFGGDDKERHTGIITKSSVVNDNGWNIGFTSWSIGGGETKDCEGKCTASIDSGANNILGPKAAIDKIREEIMAIVTMDEKGKFDCDSSEDLPDITFVINNKDFTLKAADYVSKGFDDNDKMFCTASFDYDENHWTFGTPFMMKYYTIFDKSTKPPRIGFAEAKH